MAAYRAGEKWYLTDGQEEALAAAQQSRVVVSALETQICNLLLASKKPGALVSTEEIMEELNVSAASKDSKALSMQIGDVLRKYSDGSEKKRVNLGGGKRRPCYTMGPRLWAETAEDVISCPLDLPPEELEKENRDARMVVAKTRKANRLGLDLTEEEVRRIPWAALHAAEEAAENGPPLPEGHPLHARSLEAFARTPF